MGHKHSKEEILAGALQTAFADGLTRLTYGRVAKRLEIDDRIVVYYFPTKDDLIREVLSAMGSELRDALAPAFTARANDHIELLKAAWPVLATDRSDPFFSLFFEAEGLAAAGHEPYRTVVPQLVEGWIAWTSDLVDGDADRRRAEAEAAMAIVDGLLLLRQIAGPEAAQRAARVIGIARGAP